MEKSKYKLNVLFNGFSESNNGNTLANCTCSLIKGPLNIIVDTMTAWDGYKLEDALLKHGLTADQIDYVVCTHGHSDHIGCNYLFQNATHIVGYCISYKETYKDNAALTSGKGIDLDDHVKVIPTPGHTSEDVSVILQTEDQGIVAITGDLFENMNDLNDESIWIAAGSFDKDMQRQNRNKVLGIADWIVPGHGCIFKVHK